MQKPLSHMVAGASIGIVVILFFIVVYIAELWTITWINYLPYGIMALGLIVGVYIYGKSIAFNAGFGKLFTFGFKASAILTLLVIAFQGVFFNLFPEYIDKSYDAIREQMVNEGKMDVSQIDLTLTTLRKFFWLFLIGGSIFGFMVTGAIGSIIGSLITPKKPNNFPFQDSPLK